LSRARGLSHSRRSPVKVQEVSESATLGYITLIICSAEKQHRLESEAACGFPDLLNKYATEPASEIRSYPQASNAPL
jgi:hypothetical protein